MSNKLTLTYIMQEKIFVYESPRVEAIEVLVEQGFANSYGTNGFGERDGRW